MQNTFSITGDFLVPRLGYGAMRLTGQPNYYGPYIDWDAGKQLLRHALDLGIRFIDTARAYGPGWNERLVADALSPYPDDLFIATKGGVVKKTATARFLDGSPRRTEARLRRQPEKPPSRLHRPLPASLGRPRCPLR